MAAAPHRRPLGVSCLPDASSHRSASLMTITPLTEPRFDDFVWLIHALADYEHLNRPDAAATERLRADAFGPRRRFEAALAIEDAGRAVGYAIWFETYSSFLAKPTMFLEDLFILEEARRSGAGGLLFEHVRALGEQRGCGRMDWQVLDWNIVARDFYHRRQANWMKEWLSYRIVY
jgi:GNAT superfamily N-acetyltransferase